MVDEAGPEEDRGPESVQQGQPECGPVRTEEPAQHIEHGHHPERGERRHAEPLHDHGGQSEFDIQSAPPGLAVKRLRHGPGGVIGGRLLQPAGGPGAVDFGHHGIHHRTAEEIRDGGQHGGTRGSPRYASQSLSCQKDRRACGRTRPPGRKSGRRWPAPGRSRAPCWLRRGWRRLPSRSGKDEPQYSVWKRSTVSVHP